MTIEYRKVNDINKHAIIKERFITMVLDSSFINLANPIPDKIQAKKIVKILAFAGWRNVFIKGNV